VLIANYGLFWKRKKVFWGRQGVSGKLLGTLATNLKDGQVDFREQQGIYVLYDDNFRMVYAGQTGAKDNQRLFIRLKQHERDALADRWTRFSWFGIRSVNKDGTLRAEKSTAHPAISGVLDHIEAILIAAAEPPHNRQGGRFGEKVEQYLQFSDPETPDNDEMLSQLWEHFRLGRSNAGE